MTRKLFLPAGYWTTESHAIFSLINFTQQNNTFFYRIPFKFQSNYSFFNGNTFSHWIYVYLISTTSSFCCRRTIKYLNENVWVNHVFFFLFSFSIPEIYASAFIIQFNSIECLNSGLIADRRSPSFTREIWYDCLSETEWAWFLCYFQTNCSSFVYSLFTINLWVALISSDETNDVRERVMSIVLSFFDGDYKYATSIFYLVARVCVPRVLVFRLTLRYWNLLQCYIEVRIFPSLWPVVFVVLAKAIRECLAVVAGAHYEKKNEGNIN